MNISMLICSKYLSGFRKGHSTQHCLLYMLEGLRNALDKGLCTGILLTCQRHSTVYHMTYLLPNIKLTDSQKLPLNL